MSHLPKCAGFPTPYETSTSMNGTIEDFYSKAMSPQTFKQPYIDIEEYYRLARVLIGNKPPKFAKAQQELIKACRHTPSGTCSTPEINNLMILALVAIIRK